MTTNPKSNKSIRYRSLRMESLEKREMLSAAPIDDTYTLETGGTLIYQVVENETKNAETSANIGGRDIGSGAPSDVSFELPAGSTMPEISISDDLKARVDNSPNGRIEIEDWADADYDDLVIDITFIPFQSGESFVPSCSGCCETSIAGGVGYSVPQGQVAIPENNEVSQWRWDILRETVQPLSEDGASVGSGIMQAVLEMGGLTKTVYYDTAEYDFSNAFSLGMTLDTSTLGSGRYEWTLSLTYDYGSDSAQVETRSGYSSIVDRSQSPYGHGVNLAGLSRLNLTDLNSETDTGILWERSCGKQVWFAFDGMTFTPEAGESANSTLMQNSDGTWSVRDQGETFLFSASGLLLTRTDDLTAETTVWTYNSDGTAASKTETGNRVTTYGYTNGRLASVTDFAGRVTQYEYDPLGRLIRLTEPDPDGDGELAGPVTLYTYDGDSSRLASITDSSGKVTEYTWVQGILASRKTDGIVEYSQDPYALAAVADLSGSGFDAQHPAVLSAYTQSVGTHTDKNGSTTEYRYDSRGNVIWEKTASGKVTTRMFDTNGRKLKETVTVGGSGTTTRYEYDARGNLTKLIDHDGSAEQWTWDQTYDQMLSHTDQLGNRTLYTLDPMTGLTAQERLVVGAVDSSENGETDDIVTSYAYDSARRLASMTDALGVTTSYAYDTRGNLLRETIGESVTTYTYDTADRVASVTDPLGRTTQYSYDALDRLICTTYANGQTVTNRYDALGRLAETTDIHGAVTTYTYGTNGKIAEMESEGASISYTYDTLGRVLTETDSLNRVTSYTYDNGGKVTQITVSQGAGSAVISSTEYDSWGRIASETDAAGIRLAYTYDKLGRLTRIQRGNDSKFLETRTYDAAGNLRTVTDVLGAVTSYAYDTAGNLTTVTAADGTKTTYTYDKLGRVLTQTDALGGVTSYTYDIYGNLLTTTDALGRTTANGYDLAGQLLTTTDAEGNVTAYVYDTLGRTVSTTLRSADGLGSAASTTSYTYQTIDGKKYQTVTQTDALNNQTVSLYDLAGNLIRTTDAAGAQTVYTYDTEGQLLTVTDALNHVTSYTYDAFGNVSSITQADGSTYQYRSNAAGQLLSQTDPAGTVTVHTYDVTGQVSKTEVRDRNVPKALGHWLETAQTFDGIDDKVTIENTDQLNFSGEITLSAWVKIEETGGYRGILEHGYYGGREVFLRIASGKYQVGIYQSKTNSMAEAAVASEDIGAWVHIVGTYDGSSWNLYKNGELIASSPATVGALPVNCDWLIGCSQSSSRYFKGEIRDAGIWNVALTPEEMAAHYTQGFSQSVTSSATYDALGNVLTQTDAMGNTTSYTYDTMGRVLTVTDALNNVTSYTYDALGRLLTTTDARGTVTRNTYDAVGNLLQTKQYDSTELPPPVGTWLDIEQDFNGSSTINLGNPNSLNFSGEIAVSAWVKIDTTGGIKTILGHGPSGGKEVYLRLNGNSYQFGSWDSATNNHLVSANIPAEDIGEWVHLVGTYDGANWNLYKNGELLASRADTVGCVPLTTNWYIGSSNGNARFFDGEIRDVSIWNTSLTASQAAAVYAETAPSADYPTVVTSYTYDALNRLTSLTDPVGNTTTYTYNYMGLVATETNEKNATRYYTYDALGRLISKTDRNDRVTTYAYDSVGRLTAENWVNGDKTFLYIYDSVGNLLAAGDGTSNYTYTYDSLNRNLTTTFNFDSQSAVFAYTYDSIGRQTSSSLTLNGTPSRVNTTTYDHLGNATSIRQHGNAVDEIFAEFEHNANGLLTSIRRYEKDDDTINEIAESLYEYNSNNAVTSITHNNAIGSQIVKHSYTYDETNNIVEYLNSIDGQTSYDYDFLGQLISADHANQTDESYIYDSNGNRITANGATYTTGTNNELTSDGDYTYTYDAEGNRISKTNASGTERELYTWDYRNRLTTVTQQEWDSVSQEWSTVQIVEYAYDYNNVWIRKVIGNNKTIFIPENYQTTVQIDNGTTTHHYLWTPNQQDKLLADTTNNGVLWSLTDHLGTVRDILGSEDAHLIYDAFGNLLSGTNPLLFGYTGKAFDNDTHLQNNINRWYDAAIGRWLSTDPIGFSGNDTNLYRYVRNCLISTLDCSGLWEKSWLSFLPPRKSPKECGIILYLGHGTTFGGKNDVLPIGKNRIIVPHDIGQFQQDLNSMDPSLLEAPNLFFGFLGCWANKFNVGGDILAFPKNHRIEVGGQPLDFGEIGNKMVNKIGMIKEMEMTIPTIYAFAQQLKRSGRCCSVTVFMVGNYETYLMFHRQTLKVNGQKVTLLMLTPVRI